MKQAIDYPLLKETILAISNKEVQAIVAYQYVLACRLGELFPYTHTIYHFIQADKDKPLKERKKIFAKPYTTQGLTQDCFHEFEDHWEIVMPIFKQHLSKPAYGTGFLLKGGQEQWLTDICFAWKEQAGPTLFTISHEAARKRLKKVLGALGADNLAQKTYSSHNLRDSRANHLLKLYGFNIIDIQQTLHHKRLETTKQYLNSSIDERKEKLKQATQ